MLRSLLRLRALRCGWCFSAIPSVFVERCRGLVFFFHQKTSYDLRISDWSSDVCSSDLQPGADLFATSSLAATPSRTNVGQATLRMEVTDQIGRASCRERVCQYV